MIINDLKKRRQRDYTFDLNAAFDVNFLSVCVHNYLILHSMYDLISEFLFARSVERGHWREAAIHTLPTR